MGNRVKIPDELVTVKEYPSRSGTAIPLAEMRHWIISEKGAAEISPIVGKPA